jgi:hypothetical protein
LYVAATGEQPPHADHHQQRGAILMTSDAYLELSISGDAAGQKVGKLPRSIPLHDLRDLEAPSLAPATKTHRAAPRVPSRPLPEATERHGYVLHYGNARVPMVRVVPDDRWPGMWRMIWPDSQLSDLGNLSRIRDAAAVICERGPPARNRRRFHWKVFHPEPAIAQG